MFFVPSVGCVFGQKVQLETGQRRRRPVVVLPQQLQFANRDNSLIRPHFDEEKVAQGQDSFGEFDGFEKGVGPVLTARCSDPFPIAANVVTIATITVATAAQPVVLLDGRHFLYSITT